MPSLVKITTTALATASLLLYPVSARPVPPRQIRHDSASQVLSGDIPFRAELEPGVYTHIPLRVDIPQPESDTTCDTTTGVSLQGHELPSTSTRDVYRSEATLDIGHDTHLTARWTVECFFGDGPPVRGRVLVLLALAINGKGAIPTAYFAVPRHFDYMYDRMVDLAGTLLDEQHRDGVVLGGLVRLQPTATDSVSADDGSYLIRRPQTDSHDMKSITSTAEAGQDAPVLAELLPTLSAESLSSQDADLLITLSIAGLLFLIFSIIGVTIFSRTDTTYNIIHRDTREDCLARVAGSRSALRSFLSRLLYGVFNSDEKRDVGGDGNGRRTSSSSLQGRRSVVHRGTGSHPRPDVSCQEYDTTMEQDIAGFREVASMLSSMVEEQGYQDCNARPQPWQRQQQ